MTAISPDGVPGGSVCVSEVVGCAHRHTWGDSDGYGAMTLRNMFANSCWMVGGRSHVGANTSSRDWNIQAAMSGRCSHRQSQQPVWGVPVDGSGNTAATSSLGASCTGDGGWSVAGHEVSTCQMGWPLTVRSSPTSTAMSSGVGAVCGVADVVSCAASWLNVSETMPGGCKQYVLRQTPTVMSLWPEVVSESAGSGAPWEGGVQGAVFSCGGWRERF